jgi:hypothetical protein
MRAFRCRVTSVRTQPGCTALHVTFDPFAANLYVCFVLGGVGPMNDMRGHCDNTSNSGEHGCGFV